MIIGSAVNRSCNYSNLSSLGTGHSRRGHTSADTARRHGYAGGLRALRLACPGLDTYLGGPDHKRVQRPCTNQHAAIAGRLNACQGFALRRSGVRMPFWSDGGLGAEVSSGRAASRRCGFTRRATAGSVVPADSRSRWRPDRGRAPRSQHELARRCAACGRPSAALQHSGEV